MLGSGGLVDHSALLQDMLSHATVSLLRGQEIDAAVMMFVEINSTLMNHKIHYYNGPYRDLLFDTLIPFTKQRIFNRLAVHIYYI